MGNEIRIGSMVVASLLWAATAGAQDGGVQGDAGPGEPEPMIGAPEEAEPAGEPAQEPAPYGEPASQAEAESSPPPAPPAAEEDEWADAQDADAEGEPAPNSIYFEGLGPAVYYSINYERLVIPDLAVRAGFGFVRFSASGGSATSSASFITVPITASYIGVRSGSHALELGGGPTLIWASSRSSSSGVTASGSGIGGFGSALVGYRLHPVDGAGFQFRVGLMAAFGPGLGLDASDPDAWGVLPWGYISFGGSF